jgi:hypothetical protein
LGIAVAALTVAVVALSGIVTGLGIAVDKVRDVVDTQKDQIKNLNGQTAVLNNITLTQSRQIGNLQESMTDLQTWRRDTSRDINDAMSANLGLAEDLSASIRLADERARTVGNTIEAGRATYRAALDATVGFVNSAATSLTNNITQAQDTLFSALANATKDINDNMANLLSLAAISSARFNRVVALVRILYTQADAGALLMGSVYATLGGLTEFGWRPWWSAEAASPDNAPAPHQNWGPRSPLRTLPVDTITLLTTERVPAGSPPRWPATDTYGVPGTHLAREVGLALACNGPLTLNAADAVVSGGDLLDLLGPAGCVPPLTMSLAHYLGNYTGPGARNPNPTNAPECTCWVTVTNATCPVTLAGPGSPLVTLTGAVESGLGPGTPPNLTAGGIGVGPYPGRSSPCTAAPTVSAPSRVLTSRAAFIELLATLQCPPAWAAARHRNTTAGRAAARLTIDAPSALSPMYVTSAAAAALGVSRGGAPPPGGGPPFAVGLGLPPNPGTVPPNMTLLGTLSNACVVKPEESDRVAWPTLASILYPALYAAWQYTSGHRAGVRMELYGKPHNEIKLAPVSKVRDKATASDVFVHSSEYLVVQDGAPRVRSPGDGPPPVPWVPVYTLQAKGSQGMVSIAMGGLPPTSPGAGNAVPPFVATVADVTSEEPMSAVLPGSITVVGHLDTCVRAGCSSPSLPGNLVAWIGLQRFLYNVPETALGLTSQPLLNCNKIGYLAQRNLTKVGGAYAAASRAMTPEEWTTFNSGAPFDVSCASATLPPFFCRLVLPGNGTTALGATDAQCACGSTGAGVGGMCLLLEHYGLFDADTVGGSPRDRHLIGTPAAACGPGDGGFTCFVARRSTQWVYNLPVPGGTITQTLAAACPGVDATPAALGLASFVVRAPGGAPGAVSWQYRLLCAGTDPATDDPGLSPEDATLLCTTLGNPSTRTWTPGPLLDPGSSTVVSFPSYGLANWTLQVAARDPAAPGLIVPCSTTPVVAAQGENIVPFAATAIVFSPVVYNNRALGAIADQAASTDTLSSQIRAQMLEVTMKQELLLAATNLAPLFGTVVSDLRQRGEGLNNATDVAIRAWANSTAEDTTRNDNQSALILAAFRGRISAYEGIIASQTASSAQLETNLAARKVEFDALALQLNSSFGELEVLRNESAILEQRAQDALDDLDSALNGVLDVGESLRAAANAVGSAVGDIVDTGLDILKAPFSFFGNLLGNLIPLLILAGGAFLVYWLVTKYRSRSRGRNSNGGLPAYAPVSTTPPAPSNSRPSPSSNPPVNPNLGPGPGSGSGSSFGPGFGPTLV